MMCRFILTKYPWGSMFLVIKKWRRLVITVTLPTKAGLRAECFRNAVERISGKDRSLRACDANLSYSSHARPLVKNGLKSSQPAKQNVLWSMS